MGRGGAERRSDCFAVFTPVELASGPTAPPGASLSSRRPFSHLLVSCRDLKGAGRDWLMPRQSHSGQDIPGLPLVSVSSANS